MRSKVRWTQGLICATGLLLLALFWIGTTVHFSLRTDAAVSQARRDAGNLAMALEKQTERAIKGLDQTILFIKADYEKSGGDFDLNAWTRKAPLLNPLALQVAIIDSDGMLKDTSLGVPAKPIDLSDREHFRMHTDRDTGLFISKPVLGRVSGQWSVQLSRRLEKADGSFDGVLVVSASPNYIARFLASVDIGRDGAVTLIGRDGYIRAHATGMGELYGRRIADSPLFDELKHSATGMYRARSVIDGVERIYAYRAVDETSLVVSVGISVEELLAPIRGDTVAFHTYGGIGTICFIGLLVLLVRELGSRARREAEIFEKKQRLASANQALAESESRYRTVVDDLKEVIFRTDATGVWTFLNPAWTEITGYPVKSSLGRRFLDFIHPDDRALNAERFQPLIERRKDYCRHEIRYLTRDGGYRWMEVFARLTLDGAGNVLGTAGTLNDVTDRHLVIDALKTSEARMRSIMDGALDAMVTTDDCGRVIEFNPAAERIFGYPRDAATSRLLADLILPPHRRAGGDNAVALTGPQAVLDRRIEMTLVRADGSEFPCEFAVTRSEVDGEVLFTAHLRDITLRREYERRLREAKEEAERAGSVRTKFLATMSHEIRTPLNAVIGLSGLLLDMDLDEKQRHHVGILRDSADHLLYLINDILDLAKLDADRIEMEHTVFELEPLLESCVGILQPRADARGLGLRMTIGPDVPRTLIGDPGRIRQILFNIAGNGIKFTKAGEVSIHAECAGERDGRALIRLVVRDTGIGIPAEIIPQLFQDFSQAEAGGETLGGTGLGLSISRRLTAKMGGTIDVESTPGRGTVFTIQLPLERGPSQVLERERAEVIEQEIGHHLRILLVEDNPTNQLVATAMLEKFGCRVDVAGNGWEGVQAVRDLSYDAVLMDMRMPEMDGPTAARAIRALPGPMRDVPIIALTANAFAHDRDTCLAAGMNDFLPKPFSATALRAAILAAVAKAKPDPAASPVPGHAEGEDVDLIQLGDLVDGCSEADATRFLAMFLQETEARLARMRGAAAAGELPALAVEAHSLKGAATTFSCPRLGAAAAALEVAADAGVGNEVPGLLDEVAQAFERASGILSHRLRSAA